VSNRSAAEEQALAAYGLHLGLAFQLIDDVLDYSATAEVLGKNIGADLAEGKPTLPLIHALEHGAAAERELIREAIRDGVAGKAGEIARIVMTGGALDYTRERARDESAQARRALVHLPRSKYADALRALVDFAINRQS